MSDKKKNYLLSRRRRERFERLTLRFDLISAGLAAVIILATLVSAGRPYELGLPYAHGFALWFLLLLSYIPLEVVGLFNWVFGIQDNAFMRFLVQEHQALGMGCSISAWLPRSGCWCVSGSGNGTAWRFCARPAPFC
ncbi:MAG: hypothetical protein L6W00_16205 [Lentisphaeria bacterium]|nr:MAG: hypothetical protein L6W00_16205 [Lentisphaeria bacterium]